MTKGAPITSGAPLAPSPGWWERCLTQIARKRIPLGFAVGALFLLSAQPTGFTLASGSLFVGLGLLIRTLASGFIRKNQELATQGLYRLCRNPLYLGSFVLVIGFCIMGGRWFFPAVMPPLFLIVYRYKILGEEQKLARLFGEAWSGFVQRTPRFFPRELPLAAIRADMRDAFQWSLAIRTHAEYNAWLGALGVTLLLALKAYFGIHLL